MDDAKGKTPMIQSALILSAGRGERLRPLTDRCPKPMLMLKNKPLIEHLIIQLREAGITRMVINHAYLGSTIRHHLQNGEHLGVNICYSPEPPGALETGGGIVKALPLLGQDPFICVSGDIFTDFPFKTLHTFSSSAHLVLRPLSDAFPRGDFGLQDGYVTNAPKTYVYGNIACFHPKIFKDKKITRARLAPWLRTLADVHKVTGEIYTGMWHNIGTVETFEALRRIN